MKVLIFTHKNDIDGMGNAILSKLAFDNVDYILCETFDLIDKVNECINTNKIYEYDKIFITDLCLDEKTLSYICEYLYDICSLFNKFYSECNIINEADVDKKNTYISLLKLIYSVSERLLEVLAIDIPEKM